MRWTILFLAACAPADSVPCHGTPEAGYCAGYTHSEPAPQKPEGAIRADLRCNDAGAFCDGDVAVTCDEGYQVRRFDCRQRALFCNPSGGCTTHVEPRCDPARPVMLACDGDHLVRCESGARMNADCDLDAGFACGENDAGFSCLYRGTL